MEDGLTAELNALADRLRDVYIGNDWDDDDRIINPHGQTQMCDDCTAADLSGSRSVLHLVAKTEIMQQSCADISESQALFDAANISYRVHETRDWVKAEALCSSDKGGLAYKRSDESGHMVAFRGGTLIDKQNNTQRPFESILDEGAYHFWFFFV